MKDIAKILKMFAFPIVILLIQFLILLPFNIYISYPNIDILMHFLGGFSAAYTYTLLLNYFKSEKLIILNKAFSFLFIVSLVALTAVLWEFFEFSVDFIFPLQHFQGSLPDTMLDLFLGLLGGICLTIIKK